MHPADIKSSLNVTDIVYRGHSENVAINAFIDKSPQGILYCKPWWLDAVAPGRYELLTVGAGDQIRAVWPLVWAENNVKREIVMPKLTQKLGILFAPTGAKYAEDLANQHRLIEEMIGRLPPDTAINQSFHENFTNWIPFHWHGYQQTTRYTYILEDLKDTEVVWNQMRSGMRNIIRKAQKGGLRIIDSEDVEYFYRINMMTFARQAMKPPYSMGLVQRIDDACKRNAGRKIYIAEGSDGRAHAAIYLVYDSRSTILLLSGGDDELRGSGPGSLLTWEALRFAATVSERFDFEGSMIRPVESYYRDFGGRQTPYFRIWGNAVKSNPSQLRNLAGRILRKAAQIIDP